MPTAPLERYRASGNRNVGTGLCSSVLTAILPYASAVLFAIIEPSAERKVQFSPIRGLSHIHKSAVVFGSRPSSPFVFSLKWLRSGILTISTLFRDLLVCRDSQGLPDHPDLP